MADVQMTDHSAALSLVNDMYSQFAQLGRAVVRAYTDKRISTLEGLQLGMQATSMVTVVAMLVQGSGPAVPLKDVLYVLEHGRLTLPE